MRASGQHADFCPPDDDCNGFCAMRRDDKKVAAIALKPPRKRVYIAGPISKGDLAHNVNQGLAAFNALALAGYAPFNPMWSCFGTPAVWQDPYGDEHDSRPTECLTTRVIAVARNDGGSEITYEAYLEMDFAWIAVCSALVRLPGVSKGADMEVEEAGRLGIPVFNSVESLIAAGGLKVAKATEGSGF